MMMPVHIRIKPGVLMPDIDFRDESGFFQGRERVIHRVLRDHRVGPFYGAIDILGRRVIGPRGQHLVDGAPLRGQFETLGYEQLSDPLLCLSHLTTI